MVSEQVTCSFLKNLKIMGFSVLSRIPAPLGLFGTFLRPPSIASDITSGSRISPNLIGGLGSLGISQIPSRVSRLSVLFWISSHHQQLLPLDLLVPLVGLGSRSSQSLSGPRSWLSASSSASQLHRLISQCLFRSFSAFLIFSCSRISFGRSS